MSNALGRRAATLCQMRWVGRLVRRLACRLAYELPLPLPQQQQQRLRNQVKDWAWADALDAATSPSFGRRSTPDLRCVLVERDGLIHVEPLPGRAPTPQAVDHHSLPAMWDK